MAAMTTSYDAIPSPALRYGPTSSERWFARAAQAYEIGEPPSLTSDAPLYAPILEHRTRASSGDVLVAWVAALALGIASLAVLAS